MEKESMVQLQIFHPDSFMAGIFIPAFGSIPDPEIPCKCSP